MTSFALVFFFMPFFIRWVREKGAQPIRLDGPPSHLIAKKGLPTMGGMLIIVAFMSAVFLWTDLQNPYVWIASMVFVGFGILGGVDDALKLKRKNSKGLTARMRLFCQVIVTSAALITLFRFMPSSFYGHLFFPFFKNTVIPLGFLFPIFALFVIIGSSHAVNLTDGLDGLVIGPVMISCSVFAAFTYLAGHYVFAHYLYIPFIPKAGELCILCSALVGAGLGFLWYNAPPAMIIMGDMGALPLGGFLGLIAVMIKQELVLAIVGGLFVIETLSVMIQVMVFKKTGKRVFLMAPIHHHFEKKGWTESTIVVRFWIISILLGILALSTLKIR